MSTVLMGRLDRCAAAAAAAAGREEMASNRLPLPPELMLEDGIQALLELP